MFNRSGYLHKYTIIIVYCQWKNKKSVIDIYDKTVKNDDNVMKISRIKLLKGVEKYEKNYCFNTSCIRAFAGVFGFSLFVNWFQGIYEPGLSEVF